MEEDQEMEGEMSNFKKLTGVLADNPAIAEKIAAEYAPSGAFDSANVTGRLLALAQEHGIVLTEAELEQGLSLAAKDKVALSDADLAQATGGNAWLAWWMLYNTRKAAEQRRTANPPQA